MQSGVASPLPGVTFTFLAWTTVAGVMQIIFTVLLVTMFSHRSFAAGTAFSKTEVIQAAIFEALILGYIVSLQVGIAIVIGVVAVFLLSLAKSKLTLGNLRESLFTRQTAIGLGSGASLGFCTVAYRAAIDTLESDDLVTRAGVTAAVAVLIQALLMGFWLWRRAPDQLRASFCALARQQHRWLFRSRLDRLLVHRFFPLCGCACACRRADRNPVRPCDFRYLFPREALGERTVRDAASRDLDCHGASWLNLSSAISL